jgi:hypothetical protein
VDSDDLEKLNELRTKRLELAPKFDELTKKLNGKLKEIPGKITKSIKAIDMDESSLRRTLIISVKNIQSMVIEGYELNATKTDYESRLRTIKSDYLELVIPKMPISWIANTKEEPLFERYLEEAAHKMKNEQQDKYAQYLSLGTFSLLLPTCMSSETWVTR